MMERIDVARIGNGGRGFVEIITKYGWYILNGRLRGYWEGEYTYVGARGSSVINICDG